MKKLLILVGLLSVCGASAQNFVSRDFLTYRLILSTNTTGVTNLNTVPGAYATNMSYTKYLSPTGTTNIVGQTGGTATGYSFSNSVNLLRSAQIWSRSNGQVASTMLASTNSDQGTWASYFELGDANISVTYRSGASFASPGLTLVFAPVWDGVNADMNNTWTVGFTTVSPSVTVPTTQRTNVPMSRFAGARAIALVNAWNADATPLNSECFLEAVRLNGYQP